MTIQQISDKISEAIFMNIEEVVRIEERCESDKTLYMVELETGEKFFVTVSI